MTPFEYWELGYGLGNLTPPGVRWPEGPWFKQDFTDRFFGQDVVEFGCGDGRLAELFGKRRYVGVDICPRAIAIAQHQAPGYTFVHVDGSSKIEGGHVLFAHCVMLHVPDEELSATVGRFTQRRIVISEVLGKNWRREGNPPVFNRDIGDYEDAFSANGYGLKRVQFRPSAHYRGTDLAILEAHKI